MRFIQLDNSPLQWNRFLQSCTLQPSKFKQNFGIAPPRHWKLLRVGILFFGAISVLSNGFPKDAVAQHSQIVDGLNPSSSLITLVLFDDTLDLQWFLTELNIVGEQQAKLKTVTSDRLKDWLAIRAKNLPGKSILGTQSGESLSSFENEFAAELEEILLPHQIASLKAVLNQRVLLQQHGCEYFLLARVAANSIKLSGPELSDYDRALKPVIEEFQRAKKQAAEKAWSSFRDQLPAGTATDLPKILAVVQGENKSPRRPFQPNFHELKDWRSEEFDLFETQCKINLVFELKFNSAAVETLGFSDAQVEAVGNFIRQGPLSGAVRRENTTEEIEEYRKMMETGDLEGLKSGFRESKRLDAEYQMLIVEDVRREVLTPAQSSMIDVIAEFQRGFFESGYGDEFGAAISAARLSDMKGDQLDALIARIEKARSVYYAELAVVRHEAFQRSFDLLPEKAAENYRSFFGELEYDYKAEQVAAWDQLRDGKLK